MQILITGGAGFLGQRLARTILQEGGIRRDGVFAPVDRLTLLDVVAAGDFGDRKVESVAADTPTRLSSNASSAPRPRASSIWQRSSLVRRRPISTSACG